MPHQTAAAAPARALPIHTAQASRVNRRSVMGGVLVALAAVSLSGCGSEETGSAAATSTHTSTAKTSPTTRPTTSMTTTPARPTSAVPAAPLANAAPDPVTPRVPSAPVPTAPAALPAALPAAAVMPNVMCMNLQAAQDSIQSQGVFFSRSVDATGAGRRQVIDSNWVVVGQTPLPGEPVGEAEAVLSAVKIGESGAC